MLAGDHHSLLEDPSEGPPEGPVAIDVGFLKLAEILEDAAGEPLSNLHDVPILLEHLARDIERQVGRVHDPANESEPGFEKVFAALRDHDRFGVELETVDDGAGPEVEGDQGGDEEQRTVFEPPLGLERERLERLCPVMRNVTVELGVLLLADLRRRPRPDRPHGVEHPVLDHGFRRRPFDDLPFGVPLDLGPLHRADYGVGDEVGVAFDDVSKNQGIGIVVETRVFVHFFEVQRDRGAAALTPRLPRDRTALRRSTPTEWRCLRRLVG